MFSDDDSENGQSCSASDCTVFIQFWHDEGEGVAYLMPGDAHETEWISLAELASKEMDATKLLDLVTELNRVLEHREHDSQMRRRGHTPQD